MSKDNDHPHRLVITNDGKREAERAAALLNLDTWCQALSLGANLALQHAEAHVKGETEVFFCTPEVAAMLTNNKEFIGALCEEGVVEWLEPFVLTKLSKRLNP